MSDNNALDSASASSEIDNAAAAVAELLQQQPQPPNSSSIATTPASSVTGIPTRRLKLPSNYGGSTSSVSKIGRLCSHAAPKTGPPPRDTNSMSRESDDNLSSINSAYTDLYQETVKRFTRSSLSPDMDRYSPSRISFISTSPSQKSDTTRRTSYDNYLEATGRRRSSDHGAVLTFDTEQFIIGQRVWVGGVRPGQIAYIGETHFAPGDWAGVVLDEPNGKNDGCVSGKRYFQCEPKRGIFSRLTRLTTAPLTGANTPTSPFSKNSPERSRTVSPTSSLMSTNLRSPGKNGLTVGDRVIVSSGFGSRPGILRYLGETQFASGNWCGIELDENSGKNDGSVDGIRYFECKPKYGVFVPIAKVSLSPSSKKCRVHRSGSRESLTSIGTMNSIATTNTSRMRMSAQRKSLTTPRPVTSPKSQYSMQDLLRERQNHIEKLLIERDLDREDSQNQALQYQKSINELKTRQAQLEQELIEQLKKNEDLQNLVDEATFCGDELNAQSLVYKDKVHDLEKKLEELTSGNPSLQSFVAQDSSAEIAKATAELNNQIKELTGRLEKQDQIYAEQIKEIREEETRLQDNIKYLQTENETLQKQLLEKDESLEKFSLSASGIENLKRELHLLKAENEKEKAELLKDFEGKLEEKNHECKQLLEELVKIKNNLAALESDQSNVSDECEILRAECKTRDQQLEELNEKVAALTTELNMQKAESSTLDELLNAKQKEWADEKAALLNKDNEIGSLSEQLGELQKVKQGLEQNLSKSKEELSSVQNLYQKLETKLAEEQADLQAKSELLSEEIKKNQKANMMLENLQLELKTLSQKTEQSGQEKSIEIENLQTELKKLREQNLILEKDSSLSTQQMGNKVAELEAQNHGLLDSLKASEAALQAQREDYNKQAQQLEQCVRELKTNADSMDAINQLFEKLQKEHELTVNKCQELEVSVTRSEENCAQKQLELGDLTRKLEAVNFKCTNLEEHNISLQRDVLSARGSGSDLQATVKKLNEELSAKQQSYAERENQANAERLRLESALEESLQKLAKSETESAQLTEKLESIRNELEIKNNEVSTLQEKTIKLELAVSDALRQHENLQAKCTSLSAENDSLQQDLLNLRSSSTDSNAELLKISQDLVAKQKQFDELVDRSSSERATLEGQLQSSEQRVDALCKQIEALTNELKLSSEENFKRIEQLKATEEKCSKQELDINDLSRKLESLQAKHEALQAVEQTQQEELANLRNSTSNSHAEVVKLSEELAAKQKALQELQDRTSGDRLQIESQLQDLTQQLDSSRAENESFKYELLKTKETNFLLAQEFETYKANLSKTNEEEQAQIKSAAEEKLRLHIESYEAQLQNAERTKSNLDEAISSLQNQIQLLQEELLKSQLDFKSKEEEMKRQLNTLTTERDQLRESLQRVESEESSTLSNVQQEKLALLANIQSLTDEVSVKDKQIIAITAEAEQAKLINANLSSDSTAVANKLKLLQDEVSAYESALKDKTELVKAQDENIKQMRERVEAVELANLTISATNAGLAETLHTLEQEKCELANIFELFEMEADQNMASLVGNISTMKQELSEAQAQLKSKEEVLKATEEKLELLTADLQSTRQAIQEKETNSNETSSKLQKQLEEANQQIDDNHANNQVLQERLRELEEQMNEYKQIIDEMDDSSKDNVTAIEALQNELKAERLKSQQLAETLRKETESFQAVLEQSQADRAVETLQLNSQLKMLQLQSTQAQIGAGDGAGVNEDNSAQINFLNSIIADMQKKNEELKARLHTLEAAPYDFTKPNAFDHIKKRKPAPRVFCDICDVFDSHETEDCPMQASEDYSPPPSLTASNNNNVDPANKKERKLPEPRKYCATCEVFGHDTGECAEDECY